MCNKSMKQKAIRLEIQVLLPLLKHVKHNRICTVKRLNNLKRGNFFFGFFHLPLLCILQGIVTVSPTVTLIAFPPGFKNTGGVLGRKYRLYGSEL